MLIVFFNDFVVVNEQVGLAVLAIIQTTPFRFQTLRILLAEREITILDQLRPTVRHAECDLFYNKEEYRCR